MTEHRSTAPLFPNHVVQVRSDAGLQKAVEHIRALLIEGETLDAWAAQVRLFALTHRRTVIAATSGRFLSLRRGLFGGFDVTDLRWQDLKDAAISVGIFGADLTLTVEAMADLAGAAAGEKKLEFTGLQKDDAQQVYRFCQGHEQAWREKRRVRELEEMRAKSGGVQIASAPVPAPSALPSTQPNDPVARLQQAKRMVEAKLISDAEYESIKAKILGEL
jgi:hypothetical protein